MRRTLAILIACAGFAHGQSAEQIAAQEQQNILNREAVISRLLDEQEDCERRQHEIYVPPPGNALDDFYEQQKQFYPLIYSH